jgi:hypothetical protein
MPLVWVANTWGFVDLLDGIRGVIASNVPSFDLATLWYVYTFYAPVVIISHALIFTILLKSRSRKTVTFQGGLQRQGQNVADRPSPLPAEE